MDSLLLQSIRVQSRIGVPEEERDSPQELTVSIELFLPLTAVARSDDPAAGIDYAFVVKAIEKLAAVERHTIERFAEDVAATILRDFRPAGGVKVSVRKKPLLPMDEVCVTIVRP